MAKCYTCKTPSYGRARLTGFTLLEMSIVLVIIAIVVGAGLATFMASLKARQLQETQTKMVAIQKALYDYRIANNRIPCPANITLAITAQYFGIEGATPGTCTGGNPAANFSNGNNVEGMVPTKTLMLPDDYAFDGWGRRIMYAVDKRFTATNAFTSITATDATVRMTVLDGATVTGGTTRSNKVGYVLLSLGPNGHGAYPRNGGATRINKSSTNIHEMNNCDCDSAAAATVLDFGTFVQKLPTQDSTNTLNTFDDVVYYGTRADFRKPTEE